MHRTADESWRDQHVSVQFEITLVYILGICTKLLKFNILMKLQNCWMIYYVRAKIIKNFEQS